MEAPTPPEVTAGQGREPLPLRTLLYRYFFFSWLFKNPHVGDAFERGLAVQHNRRQARWLPVYMMRWAWWGLAFYFLGNAAEIFLGAESLARWLYAASAFGLSFIVTMATAWVHLAHRPEHRSTD